MEKINKRFLVVVVVMLFTSFSSINAANKHKIIVKDSCRNVFIYSPDEHSGLHAAYFTNNAVWKEIGQLCASDYSRWGSEKRMYSPFIYKTPTNKWLAVWGVNDYSPCFAATYSDDLITWRPQDYPHVSVNGCFSPKIISSGTSLQVVFKAKDGSYRYVTSSNDFRHFSQDKDWLQVSPLTVKYDTVQINGKKSVGQIFRVSQSFLNNMINNFSRWSAEYAANNEVMTEDSVYLLPRLHTTDTNGQKTVEATLTIDTAKEKRISNHLIGVFFEDISYAADGGLYAELIQNRDFEYTQADHSGWTSTTAWTSNGTIDIATAQPLSSNNPHYAVMESDTIYNAGWDGIALKKNDKYNFSFYVRNIDSQKKVFVIALVSASGKNLVQVKVRTEGKKWAQYTTTLTSSETTDGARLMIIPQKKSKAAVDMISLFPEDTFCGHKNGLRRDLADTIAALHPKFVRFPGGCMSHGDGIDNIYHWNHTVGPLYDRKPDRNIWNYHQTRGLGFYEFFQFCEDIGAEPLPVLAAGVPCQNSSADKNGYGGQQGGIPMSDMPAYCQEILDMIEWANGNPATSKWAKMRAEAGHPAPFNLKYIGIGNEDIISTTFEDRFLMIAKAVKVKYPNITICGTVGPFHAPSSDYIEGWKFAKAHKNVIDMVDEHYYESTGWFMNNQHYYDSYDRNAPKVYLGEYAANSRPKASNVEAALAEAIHLCNIERNADVVDMTSYAPLLSKDKHQNWHPDMIYFSNTSIRTTPSYATQRLFSVHSGDTYISSSLYADSVVNHRVVASVVKDSKSNSIYIKMVNALPVAVKVYINNMPYPIKSPIAYEGFCGNPRDTKQQTLTTNIIMDKENNYVLLQPYSVNVYIIK